MTNADPAVRLSVNWSALSSNRCSVEKCAPPLPVAAAWRADESVALKWRVLCTGCGAQLRCHWLPRAADEACRGKLLRAFQPPSKKEQNRHAAARSATLGARPDPFLVLHDDFEARAPAGLPDQPGAASAAAAAVMKTKMARVLVAGDDWEAQLRAALQACATRGAPHASLHLVVGEHNLSASRRVDCRQLHSAMA